METLFPKRVQKNPIIAPFHAYCQVLGRVARSLNETPGSNENTSSKLVEVLKRVAAIACTCLVVPPLITGAIALGCRFYFRNLTAVNTDTNITSPIERGKLFFGEHLSRPLNLFHGIDKGKYGSLESIVGIALQIIHDGTIVPGRNKDPNQPIFEYVAAHLTHNEYCQLPRSLLHDRRVDIGSYLERAKKDPSFVRKLADSNLSQSRFFGSFELSSFPTTGAGRTNTICFTDKYGGYYSSHITFHFDLLKESVAKIEGSNFGGKSFFQAGKGDTIRCTNELPLTFATSIILGPEISEDDKPKVKQALENALKKKKLTHIVVIDGYTNKRNPPIKRMLATLDFTLPFDQRVELSDEQISRLKIRLDGFSDYEEYQDSHFECELLEPNEKGIRNYSLTRRRHDAVKTA